MASCEASQEGQRSRLPPPDVPRAYPYGVYDLGRNVGFRERGDGSRHWGICGGVDPRVVAFRREAPVSEGTRTCHHGGRRRQQRVSSALVEVGVAEIGKRDRPFSSGLPLPPGTSKWNKIEHRLFSFISSNWRGEPLRDYETVVHLISRTRTAKGLKVSCRLDRRVSDGAQGDGRGDA